MNHLGGQTKRVFKHEESYSINIGFPCAASIPAGAVVKLDSTGSASAFAGTGFPLGYVTVAGKEAGDIVTVSTNFVAVAYAEADGVIAVGNTVTSTGLNTGDTKAKFKKSAEGNYITGIALTAAESGAEVLVGILRVPTK